MLHPLLPKTPLPLPPLQTLHAHSATLLLSPPLRLPPPRQARTVQRDAPAPEDEEPAAAAAAVRREAHQVPRRRGGAARGVAAEVGPRRAGRVELVQVVVVPCGALPLSALSFEQEKCWIRFKVPGPPLRCSPLRRPPVASLGGGGCEAARRTQVRSERLRLKSRGRLLSWPHWRMALAVAVDGAVDGWPLFSIRFRRSSQAKTGLHASL